AQADGGDCVRGAIMELLLKSINAPGPNLSHVLLGLADTVKAVSAGLGGRFTVSEGKLGAGSSNCLEAVLNLLAQPGFVDSSPVLAEQCMQLVFRLCTTRGMALPVLQLLRGNSIDFFYSHLRDLVGSGRARCRDSFARHGMAWLLQGVAVELHVCCTGEPPYPSKARRLLALLYGGHADDAALLQQRMCFMLEVLADMDIDEAGPVGSPDGRTMEAIRECSKPLETGGGGSQRQFEVIDIKALRALQRAGVPAQGDDSSRIAHSLQWASEWNTFVQRMASQSHLCTSWRQVVEVSLHSCGGLLVDNAQVARQGSGSSGKRILVSLLSAALKKICAHPNADVVLVEPIAHSCLSIMGTLRGLGAAGVLSIGEGQALLQHMLEAICARGGAGGSKMLCAHLFGCLLHFLQHSQAPYVAGGDLSSVGAVGVAYEDLVEAHALCAETQQQYSTQLEPFIDRLVEMLGRDTTCGVPVCESLAFSLLAALMR
ncbi:unnamed protein product, partial [Chrysoparadoxa australica]